ncbi:DciA family protein [Prauserella flavalba]|uniref:DciA family protein n=1 Tax=Prauserella flavalba TaxID=1477506 RepID=UPI0036E772F1
MTEGPDEVVNTPRVGGYAGESPKRDTERNSAAGPNETGSADSPQGRDLAHAALQAARERAAARGHEPGVRRPGAKPALGRAQNPRRRRWSGPGVDERDPQPLGRLASRMATQLGWSDRLANGQVFGQWTRLVGEEVAEHAQPVALKEGELTVRASSTAWATQLRLLQRQLLAKIAAGVGHGVVKRMRIQGPTAPSWRKGPRHVPGRGPRDTYG